jgi:hypothetical protein
MKKKISGDKQEVAKLTFEELIAQLLQYAALPKECADIMGMTVDNVRNYCRRGRFEGAVQFGNEWLIPRETIESYMSTSRGRPGKKKPNETEQ